MPNIAGNSHVDGPSRRCYAPVDARKAEEDGAEGTEGGALLGGSAPNSPRSLRSTRGSKASNGSSRGSRGRGLLHCSGSSSDSDLASSHFSFKMREKVGSWCGRRACTCACMCVRACVCVRAYVRAHVCGVRMCTYVRVHAQAGTGTRMCVRFACLAAFTGACTALQCGQKLKLTSPRERVLCRAPL